jgi:hypothetical protein
MRGARLGAALFVASIVVAASAAAQDAGAPPSALPACISVATDARYVPYGYNHVVILKSGCSKAATCTVATDVNPQPATAEVAPGTTVEVLTFSGSPAQAFRARVTCKLH